MPAISYKEFSGGLDRRLPIGVQDANRLWTLTNAYVTSGKKIAKRPGLKLVANGLSGSAGLESINGSLVVFSSTGSGFSSSVLSMQLTDYNPLAVPGVQLLDVVYASQFQGYPYIVAYYYGYYTIDGVSQWGRVYRHHYIDGTPDTKITDVNCPHGGSVTKAASRIFGVGAEVVRYCAAGDARDWTTASDAGFLATSLQQDTKADPVAVGTFEDALVPFYDEGAQIWDVQVDPTSNQIRRRMSGVGTTHFRSLASFYRDLVFASPFGIRSVAVQENVERIDETDIGVPIDALVLPVQQAHEANSTLHVLGVWIQQFGQYWLVYDAGGYSVAFAYSFSKSTKLACWSYYTFPILITGIATQAGKVYVRSDASLYEVSATQYTDDHEPIDVDVQMAYQDAKLPGVEKMFYGADFVFTGSPTVSYLYDPRDPTKETNEQAISGDTRAGTLVPVEISAAAIAPRFRHSADEAFTLDLATLYYHALSAQAS